MRRESKIKAGVLAALLACSVLLPGAAAADVDSDPGGTVDPASLNHQIDAAVGNPEARAAFKEILQARIEQGATDISLTVDEYAPAGSAEQRTSAAALAYPSGCNLSVLASYSPGRATVDLMTSCTSKVWQKNVLKGGLHGWSPVNPIINSALASSTKTVTGPALYATHTVNYRCANTNRTYIQTHGSSTLTIGTSTYSASGVDDMTVNCGW